MNITGLILSFATGTYSVSRTAHGEPVRGRVNNGTTTTVLITASVSPATGDDLLRLEEGRRSNETRAVFTITQLFLGGQGETYEADVITIDGKPWEVQHVETWNDPLTADIGYRCLVQAKT